MIRLAPAPPPTAAGCRRRTRVSPQSVVPWTKPLPAHRIRCAPLLPPRQTAAADRPPLSAFDNAPRTDTASSTAHPFVGRTPRELVYWLHTQPPSGRLSLDF